MKGVRGIWMGLGGLAVALAGCVSAPTPPSVSVPWAPPAEARTSAGSWQELRAQQPDFGRPLALAELADLALQNNPASRQAWSEARIAAAQVEQARGIFLPAVTAVGAGSRQYKSSDPAALNQDYLQYGPSLQLNYLIFNIGGGYSAAVEQALQTVYAADYAFNRAIQSVLLAVETAYYGVVGAQAGVEAAETSRKDAQTVLEAARTRVAQGVGTELDVLQAQAALDQAAYVLASAQGAVKTAHAALTQALGAPADAPVKIVAPKDALPAAPAEEQLTKMIDAALERRPDIAALRARLAASEASVRVAGAAQWPSLYLNGRVGHNDSDVWAGENMMTKSEDFYGAGLSLEWTIFDGFRTASAKRAARAQSDAVRSQLRQAEVAASADVWNGMQRYATALEKFAASEAFLRSSQAAYGLALDGYQAGLRSVLDLLTAESQSAQARSQQIAARLEALTALANLAFATGELEKGAAGAAPAQ